VLYVWQKGRTALRSASSKVNDTMVKILLDSGANIDAQDKVGKYKVTTIIYMPLSRQYLLSVIAWVYFTTLRCVEVVRTLLDYNADISVRAKVNPIRYCPKNLQFRYIVVMVLKYSYGSAHWAYMYCCTFPSVISGKGPLCMYTINYSIRCW
jgi:hypothetical protein